MDRGTQLQDGRTLNSRSHRKLNLARAHSELVVFITAVRFNMTNPPKKVVKYQEAAVNSLDSKFL